MCRVTASSLRVSLLIPFLFHWSLSLDAVSVKVSRSTRTPIDSTPPVLPQQVRSTWEVASQRDKGEAVSAHETKAKKKRDRKK